MTHEKFVELTEQMRQAQKDYFKTKKDDPKKQEILSLSKKLESVVDAAIYEYKNPSLFK